jgi:hypothetical protein
MCGSRCVELNADRSSRAWRFLAHRKATTGAAVLTLAIASAACTLAVGILDQMFWRRLEAGRGLLTLYQQRASAPSFMVLAGPDYRAVREALTGEVDALLPADDAPHLHSSRPERGPMMYM